MVQVVMAQVDIRRYQRAAHKGSAAAQFRLGQCYTDGHGCTPDTGRALHWYRQAAGAGDRDRSIFSRFSGACGRRASTARLNRRVASEVDSFRSTTGPRRSPSACSEMLGKKTRSVRDAQLMLARIYEKGELVPADPQKAAHWQGKAARH